MVDTRDVTVVHNIIIVPLTGQIGHCCISCVIHLPITIRFQTYVTSTQIHHIFAAALLTAAGSARAQNPWVPPGIPGSSSPPPPSSAEDTSDPSGPTLVCQRSTLGQIALDSFTATRFCTPLLQCPTDAAGEDAAQPVDAADLTQDGQMQSRIIDCAGVCRCYVPPPPTSSSARPTPTPTAQARQGSAGSGPGSPEFRDSLLGILGFMRARR